ncbi:unnamed protein product [Spirodela intermedia]|uniref:BHLH domain-containing protein n=1 Tax=Spirodela intermedia TaxID=51605 RepID=A0A7I8KJN0_SPIIN|nr:unnamed protein product [Spirodela intermedia]
MDSSQKDKGDDRLSYHGSDIHGDWRFSSPQMSFFGPPPVTEGDQMCYSSSSSAMAAPFGRRLWETAANSQSPVLPPPALDMPWNPPAAMPDGGGALFSRNGAGIFLHGLSQFPADPPFVERASRPSSFNGFAAGGMGSPSSGPRVVISGAHSQRSNPTSGRAPPKNDDRHDHELGAGGHQEENPSSGTTAGDPSSAGLLPKKRKRGNQEVVLEPEQTTGDAQRSVEAPKENHGNKMVDERKNSSSEHGKDSAEPPKEDYVHVRARRGQATNSHSLAERVRREKISERMKFLQDLVPGCSKVTGKAVMLDEIINYVQSLQRQVEFLSMKLATVNPHLDFNIEGLFLKEILQSHSVPMSSIGFPPQIAPPQLHPGQSSLVQPGIPRTGNPSDALRRAVNAQLAAVTTYGESANQIPSAWAEELHNIQVGAQDFHGSHLKAER